MEKEVAIKISRIEEQIGLLRERIDRSYTALYQTIAPSGAAYAETVGDGANTLFNITHNLDSTDVAIEVWDLDATPIEMVNPSIFVIDADTVRVTFAAAPTVDQMRVVVLAHGGAGSSGSETNVLMVQVFS